MEEYHHVEEKLTKIHKGFQKFVHIGLLDDAANPQNSGHLQKTQVGQNGSWVIY